MTLSAIIVDDEELARRGLRARLKREGVSIVGEFASGAEALEAIPAFSPDLVFLDIQMPEMSGLQIAAALGPRLSPRVVFVTAFDEFALEAFEVNALDYLVKPIDDLRLRAAVERARDVQRLSQESEFGKRVAKAVAEIHPSEDRSPKTEGLERILVRTGRRIAVVRVSEIDWIEASGDYVSLHVKNDVWLVRETAGEFARRYAAFGIRRIHRSTLVNVDRIVELRPLDNGEYTLVLRDGSQLKLSRSYRHALSDLLSNNR